MPRKVVDQGAVRRRRDGDVTLPDSLVKSLHALLGGADAVQSSARREAEARKLRLSVGSTEDPGRLHPLLVLRSPASVEELLRAGGHKLQLRARFAYVVREDGGLALLSGTGELEDGAVVMLSREPEAGAAGWPSGGQPDVPQRETGNEEERVQEEEDEDEPAEAWANGRAGHLAALERARELWISHEREASWTPGAGAAAAGAAAAGAESRPRDALPVDAYEAEILDALQRASVLVCVAGGGGRRLTGTGGARRDGERQVDAHPADGDGAGPRGAR
jgi:hypothetical protein